MSAGAIVRGLERGDAWMWRRILAVYATAMFVGTHWPRYTAPIETALPIDKVMHVVAYAGLAGFVMLARLHAGGTRSRAFTPSNIDRSALLCLIWAGVDELTQAIPGLHRYVTWQDYAANAAGVATAWAVARFGLARARGPSGATE